MTVMSSSGHIEGAATNQPSSPSETTTAPRFSRLRPGSVSGALLIFADSFRYATIEPVNVTAPMNTPRNTSTRCTPCGGSVR